jgi:hypothetical protein
MQEIDVTTTRTAPNVSQIDQLIYAILLAAIRTILPDSQYAILESKIKQKQTLGLRRRIYDARNRESLPGNLIRSEGGAPATDEVANASVRKSRSNSQIFAGSF